MTRMTRKQLYIDEELDKKLAANANLTGVSQAEVVRRALEEYLAEPGQSVGAVDMLREHWRDIDRMGVGSGGWKWNRDELYDR